MDARVPGRQGPAAALVAARSRKLRDLAEGQLGGLIKASFRVVPQQARSMESVERMLDALERLALRARSIDGLTLEAVASEAHVTRQAAYRYFGDVHDIVRLFARRIQTVGHELLMTMLNDRRFETERDLAEAAVSFTIDAYRQLFAIPVRIRDRILRDHGEICYSLLWTLSEIVSANMSARGDPCARIGAFALNAALVAIVSVAVSVCLRGEQMILSSATRSTMLRVFLAAIGSSPSAATPTGT